MTDLRKEPKTPLIIQRMNRYEFQGRPKAQKRTIIRFYQSAKFTLSGFYKPISTMSKIDDLKSE